MSSKEAEALREVIKLTLSEIVLSTIFPLQLELSVHGVIG
jgi:hypothetical protein